MDRRKKIILISVIVILLIVIIVLFLLFNPFKKTPTEELPPANTNENQAVTVGQIDLLPPPSPERIKDEKDYPLGLESLASSFAARFASYSTDAKFKNLQDLKILSTPKMQSYIDNFIKTRRLVLMV
jgi:hypothetical protein